jgi:hypothetical protein
MSPLGVTVPESPLKQDPASADSSAESMNPAKRSHILLMMINLHIRGPLNDTDRIPLSKVFPLRP